MFNPTTRTLLCTAVLALALSAPAQGDTVTTPSAPYSTWVRQSAMPSVDERLSIDPVACPTADAPACTTLEGSTVWFDLAGLRGLGQRWIFWHELGHRFDYAMPEWARVRFMSLTGLSGDWRQPLLQSSSPHELFAESYAVCAQGHSLGHWALSGVSVTASRAVCRMIVRLG